MEQGTGSYNISTTGWQGVNFGASSEGRDLIKKWETYEILWELVKFTHIPYDGVNKLVSFLQLILPYPDA